MLSIFFRKMLYFEDRADFKTFVLKSVILQDLENDRPVGRSFSRNLGFRDSLNLEEILVLNPLSSSL